MPVPVKDRLRAGGQGLGHEAQLQEGAKAAVLPGVHHPVQVGKAVFHPDLSVRRFPLLINAQLVAEQAVPADIAEVAQVLHAAELLLVFLMQGQADPPGAHAVRRVVGKGDALAAV